MQRTLAAALLVALSGAAAIACSGVALVGEAGVVVGANEDNLKTDASMWATAATDSRYGAVYFGFHFVNLGGRTPGWYEMQGVNDRGLFYDLFSIPCGPHDTAIDPLAGGPQRRAPEAVERTMMETCSTVEEALAFLEAHDYARLVPCVQTLLVDRAGDAAVYTGEGNVFRKGPALVVTNFNLLHPERGDYPCERYSAASRLAAWDATATLDRAGQILRAARFIPEQGEIGGPRYAVACDLVRGIADVYTDGDFSRRARLDLAPLWQTGLERVLLADLELATCDLP